MKKNQKSPKPEAETTTTVHQLVFEVSEGIRWANDALLRLVELPAFAHQKKSLREDAAQLREFRGDILGYVLATWQDLEDDEADELRAKRRAREQREREADEASIAKYQAGLKSGKIKPPFGSPKTLTNGKKKGEQVPVLKERAKARRN